MPRSSRRLLDPEDHRSLEDITLHGQLGDLGLELAYDLGVDLGRVEFLPWASLSLATQLANVPGLIPRSRATWAMGFPVSRTIPTAPSWKSRSYRRLFSGMPSPYAMAPRKGGIRTRGVTAWWTLRHPAPTVDPWPALRQRFQL